MNIPIKEIVEGFSTDTWKLLAFIVENPGQSYRDLRTELNFTQTKTEKELSRLEGALLIKTERNPGDKRLTLYKTTDYGREALKFNLTFQD
jgi:DNA-binding MarR family transcriptional regulator